MRKSVHLLELGVGLYLLVAVPTFMVDRLFNEHASIAFLLAVVLFGAVQVQHGPRWCAGATVLGAGAVFLSGVWATDPIPLALVVGGTAFLAGASTRWARQTALIAVPITAAVLSTSVSTADAAARAVGILAGGLYGAVVLTLLKLPARPLGAPLPRNMALLYGAIMGLLAGVATAIVTKLGLPHGYWLTLTFLAVMTPTVVGTRLKTFQRVAGTIVGSGLALLVAMVVPTHGVEIAVGLAFVIASAVLSANYQLYTALMTIGVVLLVEGKTPAGEAVELRLGLTLTSGLIVVGLCYLVPSLLHRLEPKPVVTDGHS
jgi:hypothetical protein